VFGIFSLRKFGISSAVYKPKITHKLLPTKLYSETGPRVSVISSLVFRTTNMRGIFTRQSNGTELKITEFALVKK
jgi:hypothetical protein